MREFYNCLSIILFMTAFSLPAIAQSKILFELSFQEPQTHYVNVKMNVSGINKDYVDIKMPVWTPGSYLIREYSKNVEGFNAVDASGKALSFEKTKKNTWRIHSNKGSFNVSYKVYSYEISVRTNFVDASHGFIVPAATFMYVDGMINHPSTITVKPHQTWSKISTGLEPVSGSANTFYASDFDILFDSPIETGNQDVFEFNAAGVRHEVAMYGGGNYDKERLKKDMASIVETETAVFGENPNKHYVFIVHNYTAGGGGIEHLNSTVLGAARASYDTEAGYRGFLRLVAHEYFHLWNVKRLRPIALGPFDYENENYTPNLWIAEGFTTFFEKVITLRSGFSKSEDYLDAVVTEITNLENQPGSKIQSASEASFDAWIKYYRPNENSGNSTISYYSKGSIIGLLMNLEILNATRGEKSLDDLMKSAYNEYYKKQKRGYTDAEFRAMAENLAGKSLEDLYKNYINGTSGLDYNTYLGFAGLRLTNDNMGTSEAYLGVATSVKDGKLVVTNVSRNSAAWTSGINVNDEIISVDGARIGLAATEITRIVSTKKVGEKISILFYRDGKQQVLDVTLLQSPNLKYRIRAVTDATPEQLIIRKKLLNL